MSENPKALEGWLPISVSFIGLEEPRVSALSVAVESALDPADRSQAFLGVGDQLYRYDWDAGAWVEVERPYADVSGFGAAAAGWPEEDDAEDDED